MCIEANYFLSGDMKAILEEAGKKEESPLGKQILNQLEENLKIAGEDKIPIEQNRCAMVCPGCGAVLLSQKLKSSGKIFRYTVLLSYHTKQPNTETSTAHE